MNKMVKWLIILFVVLCLLSWANNNGHYDVISILQFFFSKIQEAASCESGLNPLCQP